MVRLRTRVTKGAGVRAKALLVGYELLDMAAEGWRKLDSAQLLAQVRAGVNFFDGGRQGRELKGKEQEGKAA